MVANSFHSISPKRWIDRTILIVLLCVLCIGCVLALAAVLPMPLDRFYL
jgi:hypothetical protein